MYNKYVSYITLAHLKVHVLNKYIHKNSLMRSYLSRGLITRKQECFSMYQITRARCTYWDGTSNKNSKHKVKSKNVMLKNPTELMMLQKQEQTVEQAGTQ